MIPKRNSELSPNSLSSDDVKAVTAPREGDARSRPPAGRRAAPGGTVAASNRTMAAAKATTVMPTRASTQARCPPTRSVMPTGVASAAW